jgi:far upstream element-binding protein
MCIGRSGCVVREMQNKSGCKIQIPSQSTPGALFRIATVNGPQAGCQMVKQMIERIILEQSSQSVMSGTGYDNGGAPGAGFGGQAAYGQQHGGAAYGGGYGQHQAAYGQQTGYGGQADTAAGGAQGDYSAEWAAYYAAQAAATAAPAAAAPAPAGQHGADAYYEQFHRYAYYYGEPAARQYYGAWSPPVGTPNPYGTNPSGITAPPDAAPAPAAAAPAAAPVAAAPAARDTGRRGVSNLPAWMTKGN